MRSPSLAAIGLAVLALPAPAARAFVCTETQSGGPSLSWDHRDIEIRLVPEPGEELSLPQIEAALRAGLDQWTAPACSDFAFVFGGDAADPRAGFDWEAGAGNAPNENILAFRNDRRDEAPEDAWLHPAGALAITTVTFVRSSGRILDADIEVNDAGFEFTACEPEACVVVHDLANALAHELGHVVGLDHPPSGVAGARETTMFASAPPGEIQKRDLSQDDIDGLCTLYPAGGATGQCGGTPPTEPPELTLEQVGCSGGGPAAGPPWLSVLLTALGLGALRHRPGPKRPET